MDVTTVEVYERRAADYAAARPARYGERARQLADLAEQADQAQPMIDLGCGPGGYLADLGATGRSVVAFDAAWAMLGLGGHRPAVQGELERLPFRRHGLAAGWARNTYLHVRAVAFPMALASLHHALRPDAPITLSLLNGDGEGPLANDDLGGRTFTMWRREPLQDVLTGAGFDQLVVETIDGVGDHPGALWATGRRARTLPDFVGPGMHQLICGLNPSLVAADAGYGFAGATNRFWRAALDAGLVSRPRNPWHALAHDGVGMTDLCKRATPRSNQLSAAEYAEGLARVERLVRWLRPATVVFVGLEGWRAAVDTKATAGWQPSGFAGAPAYVMPSTSGINARSQPADLAAHLRIVQSPPPSGG